MSKDPSSLASTRENILTNHWRWWLVLISAGFCLGLFKTGRSDTFAVDVAGALGYSLGILGLPTVGVAILMVVKKLLRRRIDTTSTMKALTFFWGLLFVLSLL